MSPNDSADAAPLLVYDGECGFCSRAVRFMLERDPGGPLRFAARAGHAGSGVRERHPAFRQVDALLWVEHEGGIERVYAGSDATLRAGAYLGGTYRALSRAGRLVPRVIRESAYGVVARARMRLFGRVDPSCMVVPASERHRFLP